MRAFVIVAFLLAPLAQAQEQGAGAQKDKEKAKPAGKKAAPAYTDDDLKKARESGQGNVTFLASPPAGSSSSGSAGDGNSDEQPLSGQRQTWGERAASHREAVAAAEVEVKALESRLGELTNDMSQNPGDLFDPSRLQKREAEKNALIPKVEAAKAALEEARKAQADFEREAREKNIPPGWLQPQS